VPSSAKPRVTNATIVRRLSGRALAPDDHAEVRADRTRASDPWRQAARSGATDAVDYAASLLRRLAPPGWQIAICDAAGTATRVESGRAWGNPTCERWAMFFVGSGATREEIWRAAMTFATHSTSTLVLRALAEEARQEVYAN
jgi:hypothetical protein